MTNQDDQAHLPDAQDPKDPGRVHVPGALGLGQGRKVIDIGGEDLALAQGIMEEAAEGAGDLVGS